MYHSIVMTCGISLFSPHNLFGKWTRQENFFRFNRLNPEILNSDDPEEKVIKKWLLQARSLFKESIRQPTTISAEYSMLNTLYQYKKLATEPYITLFHTDTLGGKISARLLKNLFEHHFHATVQLKSIISLNLNSRNSSQLNRALGDFMYDLSQALLIGHKDSTCFAPIGGYKVMTSFGYLVGAFHGYPTAYLNEEAQTALHIIPPVPIDVDPSFFNNNEMLIRDMVQNDLIAFSSLSIPQQQVIRKNASLFTLEDDYVYLNPFGEFLFKRREYAAQLQTRIFLSESAQQAINQAPSKQPFAYQQIINLMDKAKRDEIGHRGELYHERDFKSLNGKKLLYHLYKGASNGGLFRATWRYDKEQDHFYLNQIWLEKPYEHNVVKGKGLLRQEGKFMEITHKIYDTMK